MTADTRKEIQEKFDASRQQIKSERFRPAYHFTPPIGRSNDPNGLCFWRNKWHLFYQFFPPAQDQISWGHAISTDLIHWQDLPPAINPGPETGSWSGATWVEADRVIAMYHGYGSGNMVAVSSDENLLEWEKISGKSVLPNPLPIWCFADGSEKSGSANVPAGAINFVYDPCIWQKGEYYYSLSGGAHRLPGVWKRHRQAYLFRSRDLKEWEYVHEFIEGDFFGNPGDDCGCPYFMPIGSKYILIHYSHRGSSHYMIGDYDTVNDKFHVLDSGHFGFSNNFPGGIFAPTAFPDGSGGVILMLSLDSGHWLNGEEARQVISLPRRLTLTDNELLIEPVQSTGSLRCAPVVFTGIDIPANREVLLDGCSGNVAELEVEVDWQHGNWQLFEVNVLRSPDSEEVTSVRFHKQSGYRVPDTAPDGAYNFCKAQVESVLSIDASHSSSLPETPSRIPENAPVCIPAGENLKLRIFIDKSILEVFVNNRQCAAVRVYPGREESTGISFSTRGGSATIKKCVFCKMKNIWDK